MIHTDKLNSCKKEKPLQTNVMLSPQGLHSVRNYLLSLQFKHRQVKSLHLPGLLLPVSLSFLPLFPSLFNFLPLLQLLPLCQTHENTHLVRHTYTHSHRQSHPLTHTLSSRDPECLARSNCTEILCSPYKVAAASHVTRNLHAAGREFALHSTLTHVETHTYAHAKPCFPL